LSFPLVKRAKTAYPEPQNTVPLEIAAPARHEPPLSNCHRTAPVAASKANIVPA
jgi:hypothetical protein